MRPYNACVQIERRVLGKELVPGEREKEPKCSFSVSAFIWLFSEYFYPLAVVISLLVLCNIE